MLDNEKLGEWIKDHISQNKSYFCAFLQSQNSWYGINKGSMVFSYAYMHWLNFWSYF